MQLVLSGAQAMLAKTAKELNQKHSPVTRLRELRDSRDQLGYSVDVWREMAELGWTAIPFAEEDGGLGMGMAEMVLITEEMGRALAPEPLISSAVLAGRLLAGAAGEVRSTWLPDLVTGEKRLAVAHHEARSRFDLHRVSARAWSRGSAGDAGWLITAEKEQVIDGWGADGWIVVARTSGETADEEGITLFLVPADRAGVHCERQWRIDSRNAAILRFEEVEVAGAEVVGEVGGGLELLADAVDAATVALCGEMLGGMSEAFERTLEYLKTREQFEVPIGSFQALQHRATKLFIEIELCRSVVMAAARAIDEGSDEARALVSNAKARCSDAYILVTNEGLQMHGGIGMTDEHDIGLFLKRARVAELTFGDSAFHRDRFARLNGF